MVGCIRIRRFEFTDFAELMEVEDKSYPDPYKPAEMLALLNEDGIHCYVATDATGVVGFALHETSRDVFSVVGIAVLPAYRRRGIGRQLLDNITDRMGFERHRSICGLFESNLCGQLFLSKCGFDSYRILYEEPEDIVFFEKRYIPSDEEIIEWA